MTNEQAKQVFNQVAAAHRANGNPEQAAQVELVREYLTNPEFKKALEGYVWELNKP